MQVDIRELTPELVEDYLAFFDRDAFPDNPEWDGCYCVFDHWPHGWGRFDTSPKQLNRGIAEVLVKARQLRGYLAYDGARPIGWLQATRRDALPDLRVPGAPPAAPSTGVVTCFVITPPARGKGIARELLSAAVAGMRAEGLAAVEAFAPRDPENDAHAFRGPESLYRGAGFVVTGETEHYLVMRLTL